MHNDRYAKLAYSHSYFNHLFMLEPRNVHAYKLFNNNKIRLLCAGFETTAMIDTGASISVIDKSFLEKINLTYCVDSNRQILCKLADGTTITLDKKIVLPIKFNNITIEADLFILPMNHVRIIIGCDLLHLLNARIDFSSNTLVLQEPLPITKIACLQHNSLGHLEVTDKTHTQHPSLTLAN